MRRLVVALTLVVGVLATGCFKSFDFDGDGVADLIYVDGDGAWFELDPDTGEATEVRAGPGGFPVPGDYDGNGRWDHADIAGDVWRSNSDAGDITFPRPTGDPNAIPTVQGNWVGDRKTDPAYYRESDGTWWVMGQPSLQLGSGPSGECWDSDADFPVPEDYDGDGKFDHATWNPRTSEWRIRSSRSGTVTTATHGGHGAMPAPGDYDGDRRAERAIVNGTDWVIEGQAPISLPVTGSMFFPTVADYDGDGRDDPSFVILGQFGTPSEWWIRSSAAGTWEQHTLTGFGTVAPATLDYDMVTAASRFAASWQCALDAAG